jgi:tetratricopeptide (TPR) repeat protein
MRRWWVFGFLLLVVLPAFAGKSGQVRKDAFELLNEGVAAYNRNDFAEAIDRLNRSAAVALNSYRAHYYLGLSLIGAHRYAEAVEPLQIALDLEPNEFPARVALGDARLQLGDTQEAMAEYYRALRQRPEFAPALDGVARVSESVGDDEQAVAFFKRAIKSNEGYADAYVHLGDLYLRKGELREAVELLIEVVTVRPDCAPGLNRLALAYSRLGLNNEAVATINRAITLEPRVADHRAALGQIQLAMNLAAGAEASFREALALDSSLPAARAGMAEIARRRGDYDAGITQIDALLREAGLGSLAQKKYEAQRAAMVAERDRFTALETTLASGRASPADLQSLAEIYAGRGLWDRAAELQSGAGSEPLARQRLAYMLLRAGRNREAQALYAELGKDSTNGELALNEGVARARLGDHAGAAEAYRRALRLEPDLALAQVYLGNALLRLGREPEAVEAYRTYLTSGADGPTAERVQKVLDRLVPPEKPAAKGPSTAPEKPTKKGSQP